MSTSLLMIELTPTECSIETPDYIQITGTGQLTNMNVIAGDAGGELDPHGAGKIIVRPAL